jgi:hypothetical protein
MKLWRSLREGIREPHPMGIHIERLLELYANTPDRREEVVLHA